VLASVAIAGVDELAGVGRRDDGGKGAAPVDDFVTRRPRVAGELERPAGVVCALGQGGELERSRRA
jgi:hypothetical protein